MNPTGFKILGINHIGIVAKDTDKARVFFGQTLGLSHFGDELVAAQKTLTSIFASAHQNLSNSRLELLENQAGEDGPIAKFLAKKGAGIHHIALQVDDIDAALSFLKTQNVKMIDAEPRDGAHHTKIAFIHPESTGGILIELVQES